MPLARHEIIRLCELISEQEDLKATLSGAFTGACYTFAGALIGGILGGPLGLGIGSVATGTITAIKSQGNYKSAIAIIVEMNERDQQKLIAGIQRIVRNIDTSNVAAVMLYLNSNAILKDSVLSLIKNAVAEAGYTLV